MELGWWNRDDEGNKYQVHLELFGGKLLWRCQRKRHDPWQDYTSPSEEDWKTALELAENRYQRRLTTKDIVERIRRRELG